MIIYLNLQLIDIIIYNKIYVYRNKIPGSGEMHF